MQGICDSSARTLAIKHILSVFIFKIFLAEASMRQVRIVTAAEEESLALWKLFLSHESAACLAPARQTPFDPSLFRC